MDFRTVPAVIDALAARVQHGIFGYTENGAADKAAEVGWLKRVGMAPTSRRNGSCTAPAS